MARALALHARGHRFDSDILHNKSPARQVSMERSLDYDLNFFYKYPQLVLQVNQIKSESKLTFIIKQIENLLSKHKKFCIVTPHETIKSQKLLDGLIDYLDYINTKDDIEVYLSMTTSTSNKNFLNPLCSILHYQSDYFNKALKEINHTNKDLDFFSNPVKKINKGILSIRARNHQRELFYQKNNNNFDGIFRYNEYEDVQFGHLMTEIKESFVYFNFETLSDTNLNCFTEKSLLGFLSNTLPIVYLDNERRLKEYEKMGFYLFNKELDYIYASNDIEKNTNEFVKCIEKYNNLSLEEIKNLFEKNYIKIKNNYKIAYEILFNNINANNTKLSIKEPI